jgi:TRAP-type mannitol/chloroaromatic compound transport system permease small subunit
MNKTIAKLLNAIDSFTEWTGRITSFLVIPLIIVVVWDIVSRRFGIYNSWVIDITIYAYVFHYLLGMAYTQKHLAHASVDVFTDLLSARKRAVISALAFAIFLVPFVAMILWYGGHGASHSVASWERSTFSPWGPIVWPLRVLLPVAFFLLLLQSGAMFVRDVTIALGKDYRHYGRTEDSGGRR